MSDISNRRYIGIDNGFGVYEIVKIQLDDNPILLTDDYGTNWYRCHASNRLMPSYDVIIFGSLMPNTIIIKI